MRSKRSSSRQAATEEGERRVSRPSARRGASGPKESKPPTKEAEQHPRHPRRRASADATPGSEKVLEKNDEGSSPSKRRKLGNEPVGEKVESHADSACCVDSALEIVGKQLDQRRGLKSDEEVEENSGLTELERQREELMKRNKERMLSLQLHELAAPLATAQAKAQKATQRGISSRKVQGVGETAPRRSMRQKGIPADSATSAGIDYETSRGQVVLMGQAEEEKPKEIPAELPFKSIDGSPETDSSFLSSLRTSLSCEGEEPGPIDWATSSVVKTLRLAETDVQKVIPKAITMVEFAPLRDGKLLVASADKEGFVSLWDVDRHHGEHEDDGVVYFMPHRQYVSGMAWRQGGASLLTCSYDSTIRRLDVEKGVFELVHNGQGDDYSAFDCCEEGKVAYVASNRGTIKVCDLMANPVSPAGKAVTIHAKKINSVHLEPTGQPYLTTASSDNTVCVWDLRKTSSSSAAFTRPLAELRHGRSCHSAFWDPTGTGRIATVSFDDTVRIFGQSLRGAGYVEEVTTRHNNNTGRYIVPFKPRWSPAGDAIVVGCMQRGFDVIDAGSGEITCNVTGEWLTAIPARTNFHPWRPVVAACTGSGRIAIFR